MGVPLSIERPSRRQPIATLNEGPLHAALKSWYLEPGDETEVPVDGRQVDIVRGRLLVEIQTRSFASIRRKLERLVQAHPLRLVHPVAAARWIVRVDGTGAVVGKRKSPRKGRLQDVFSELVALPRLLAHPNFSLEVVLIREEERRRHEPGRAWRRKGWVTTERRLIDVVERHLLRDASDLAGLLPPGLPVPFTTGDLAQKLNVGRSLAQRMAYCLRKSGNLVAVGKEGNALRYRVAG